VSNLPGIRRAIPIFVPGEHVQHLHFRAHSPSENGTFARPASHPFMNLISFFLRNAISRAEQIENPCGRCGAAMRARSFSTSCGVCMIMPSAIIKGPTLFTSARCEAAPAEKGVGRWLKGGESLAGFFRGSAGLGRRTGRGVFLRGRNEEIGLFWLCLCRSKKNKKRAISGMQDRHSGAVDTSARKIGRGTRRRQKFRFIWVFVTTDKKKASPRN